MARERVVRERKDRVASWMVNHHGLALVTLAGVAATRTRSRHNVLTHPKRLPDGFLDVIQEGSATPLPFLVEVESYPLNETLEQIRDDVALVLLERGVVPDVILLVLRPRGNVESVAQREETSAAGLSRLTLTWHLIEVHQLDAEQLFPMNEVGLIPLVPLTKFSGPPEVLMRRCRERIEEQALPAEKENLLVITRVFAETRFTEPQLLNLLFEVTDMIESPFITRMEARGACKARQKDTLDVLGVLLNQPIPEAVTTAVRAIDDADQLEVLLKFALRCPDLESFRRKLGLTDSGTGGESVAE